MVSPYGIQLAAHLISSFYGELCSKVCECLLRRGTLTLAQIIRFTELSRENVINCLRVLIHQNCVQAFANQQEGAFGEAPRIVTQYIALFDNMIHKLRAPKFLRIVSEELGNDCLEVFHGLIQHGRLSLDQIIDRNEQTAAGGSHVHVVRESFNKLLNSHFIERCPAPEPFIGPPAEDETPAKKRGARSAKTAEGFQTIEQRALAAAAPMESLRFLMEVGAVSEEIAEESPMRATPGEKRKKEAINSDEDFMAAGKKKEVLWRVNYEEFVRRLKDKVCISNVKTRLTNEAGIVLRAILELSKNSVTRLKDEESAYLSINAICDEVIKKADGIDMDFERIRAGLDQLECQILSTATGETYRIDIKGIIEKAQNEEVEAVVLQRYGTEAHRIYRLLSKAGHLLETDKISDSTFVEKKDTLKILYELWKDDYVHMEKIMVNGAKQSLLLLWRVNKQPLYEQVLDEMYHSALNLRLRIMHEQDRGKEVLQLPQQKLVGELEEKYKKIRKIRIILESSLMNLDDSIILFM